MLPTGAGNIILKNVIGELVRAYKYATSCLQIAFSMQLYNNGNEIYKNVGVMHAVVFADGAREAKNAQVVGENQNSEGLKKRKNRDRNG